MMVRLDRGRNGRSIRRPSVDPVLRIRTLTIGYVFAVRSE
jgi:hypothetical protein